jgi:hypothetical protein
MDTSPVAVATASDTDLNTAMNRHAAEWGLASLLCGCMLLLAAPVTLILVLQLADVGRRVMGRTDLFIAFIVSTIAMTLVIALTIASLIGALKSLLSARSRKQPAALGFFGVLVAVFAIPLWGFTAADLLITIWSIAH